MRFFLSMLFIFYTAPVWSQSYANTLATVDNLDDLETAITIALEQEGPSFAMYTAIGEAYYRLGDFPSALDAFHEGQIRNTYSYTGYNRIGLALLAMENYRSAEVAFRVAVTLAANTIGESTYLANLGLALEGAGDTESALAIFQAALQINASQPTALEGITRIMANEN